MAVYIRDVADVWLEGTVSTVNKSTCAVFLTNQQVKKKLSQMREWAWKKYMSERTIEKGLS